MKSPIDDLINDDANDLGAFWDVAGLIVAAIFLTIGGFIALFL